MNRESRKLKVQPLENRQLMAGDVSFDNGVLEVRMAEDGADWVHVGASAGYVQVSGNANIHKHSPDRIPAAHVRSIRVLGTDDADVIKLQGINKYTFPQRPSVTVVARGGADIIHGSELADTIFAGAGDDDVWGHNGNDRIFGQGGHDELFGLNGRDMINGGRGHDKIVGGNGRDTLRGGPGNDHLYGHGHSSADRHRDRIFGGSGFDTYRGFRSDPDFVHASVEHRQIF